MTWNVVSTTDSSRWLSCSDGMTFTADPETAGALEDPATHQIPIHPGGPLKTGLTTPADLFVAAWRIIPDPVATGDYPTLPAWPTLGGLLVY